MLTFKLAASNIRKGFKSFAPFLMATTTMFVLILVTALIGTSKSLLKLTAGGGVGQLMSLASTILTIFAVIILIYSYRFLQLQRLKEFGLYDILGFGKAKIAIVAFFELIFSFIITVIVGTLIAIAFGKFLFLIFVNLVGGAAYNLDISISAIATVVFVFLLLFGLLFIIGCIIIWKSSSLDLLREESKGEKEPKSNVLMAILGVALIAAGYIIAVGVQNPMAALSKFFLAVILVIFGTYLFYIASTIWYLKWRKKKDSYYQPQNFITISSLLYRMKANAAGLANITILLSMAIVTIVTTVGIYVGTSSAVQKLFPREAMAYAVNDKITQSDMVNSIENAVQKINVPVAKSDILPIKSVSGLLMTSTNSHLTFTKNSKESQASNVISATLATAKDVSGLGNQLPDLANNQIIIYDANNSTKNISQINAYGQNYQVKAHLKSIKNFSRSQLVGDRILIIFPTEEKINQIVANYNNSRQIEDKVTSTVYAYFDIAKKDEIAFNKLDNSDSAKRGYHQIDKDIITVFRTEAVKSQQQGIGGFVFIGFVLGIAFILGAALIIYYKQLSEGSQDKQSFKILQEVGLSKYDVQKTIKSQVRMLFFLPIVVTIVHFGFAFNMIAKIEEAFQISNVKIMLMISIVTIIFVSALYWIIYKLTSRVYYKIVER